MSMEVTSRPSEIKTNQQTDQPTNRRAWGVQGSNASNNTLQKWQSKTAAKMKGIMDCRNEKASHAVAHSFYTWQHYLPDMSLRQGSPRRRRPGSLGCCRRRRCSCPTAWWHEETVGTLWNWICEYQDSIRAPRSYRRSARYMYRRSARNMYRRSARYM